MANSETISIDQFNSQVRGWTTKVRSKMASNAPVDEGNLSSSVSYAFTKNFGHISTVRYNFPRHGIYVHYGVGRGYIRQGGTVIRGSKIPVKNQKQSTGINRHPNDWFDVEIKKNMPELANYVQDFYGDIAMQQLLEKLDKFLIEK